MFSFRKDKTGFFSALTLIVLVAGTAISTLVLVIVGLAQGDWKAYILPVKWILGSAWVASIITVLVRVSVFGVQRQRQLAEVADSNEPPATEPEPPE